MGEHDDFDKRWITVTEAARRLNVHRTRVHQLIDAHRTGSASGLPARRIGIYWLVDAAAVEARAMCPPPSHRPARSRAAA